MLDKTKTYLKVITSIILFFMIIGLYAFEIPYFSNTFGVKKMLIIALVIGLLIGMATAYYFQKGFEEQMEKLIIVIACLFASIAILPLFMSMTNRLFSFQETKRETYELFSEQPFGESRFGIVKEQLQAADGFYIFIVRKNKLERIKSKVQRFKGLTKGTLIELPVRKGLWGFEFVDF